MNCFHRLVNKVGCSCFLRSFNTSRQHLIASTWRARLMVRNCMVLQKRCAMWPWRGATDGGKSSIMRLLMAQLCKASAQVLLLNPHFTRYDIKKNEDWTPFEPYLLYDPMECRKYEVIEHYLRYTAETLLPNRLDKYANSPPCR